MTTSTRGNTNTTGLARTRSRGEETKPSFKTSELVVYVLAVLGVLIASAVTGDEGTNNGGDIFAADKAWWFITLLTIGYLVSRGRWSNAGISGCASRCAGRCRCCGCRPSPGRG